MRRHGLRIRQVSLIWLILAAPVSADDRTSCLALLDKAIKAQGLDVGQNPLLSIAWKSKGKYVVNGEVEVSFTEEGIASGTDRLRIDLAGEAGDMTFKEVWVLNRDKGWLKESIAQDRTTDLPKDLLVPLKESFHAVRIGQILPSLREQPYGLAPLGELKLGSHDAVGIRVSRKDRRDVNLYFDKKTSLLLKSEVRLLEWKGRDVTYEFFYADFTDHDGRKYFSRLTVKREGKLLLETKLRDLKAQPPEDSAFDRP